MIKKEDMMKLQLDLKHAVETSTSSNLKLNTVKCMLMWFGERVDNDSTIYYKNFVKS